MDVQRKDSAGGRIRGVKMLVVYLPLPPNYTMKLQDQFNVEEKKIYTEKVNDIFKLIKAFRQEKVNVNEPKIRSDASAYYSITCVTN